MPTVRPNLVIDDPERDDLGAVVPAHELGRDERDRRRQLERAGEAAERLGLGGGVLREEPDRVAVQARRDERDRRGEAGRRRGGDDRLGRRGRGDLGDAGVLAAEHDRQDVDRPRLPGQGCQRPPQMEGCGGAAVGARDEDGVDSGGHDVVSLGAAARRGAGARAAGGEIGCRGLSADLRISWRGA